MLLPYHQDYFHHKSSPPCALTIFFDMKRPSPVPPVSDLVVNLVNSLGNTSASIPAPVSFMLTRTSLSFFSVDTVMIPSFVNLIALLRRLEITRLILPLSATTQM